MSNTLSVLVVDDNAELAENIAEILGYEDIASEVANNGPSALDKLARRPFDLVITDIRMPGMSGVELLRNIRERWPALPVIVMSAYAKDSTLEDAAKEGALEVLYKPVDISHVLGLIERVAHPKAPVLLVEDDDALRASLAECLLELADVVPYAARDLAEAERLLARVPFRAVVLDVRLPDGDGLEFGRRLEERLGDIPAVVYVTAYDVQGLARAKTGDRRILEKPFSPSQLLDLLTELIH